MVRLNRTHYSLLQAKVLNLSFKIWYGLTVHIIHFYRQNFQFFKIVPSSQNSSELRKFRAIRPHSPRIRLNSHILLLCFRYLLRQRTLENSSKLRRFRTILPQLPRITRNSLNPHHNKQTRSPSRELQETYSECRKLCTFRTMHGQITQNSQHLP